MVKTGPKLSMMCSRRSARDRSRRRRRDDSAPRGGSRTSCRAPRHVLLRCRLRGLSLELRRLLLRSIQRILDGARAASGTPCQRELSPQRLCADRFACVRAVEQLIQDAPSILRCLIQGRLIDRLEASINDLPGEP